MKLLTLFLFMIATKSAFAVNIEIISPTIPDVEIYAKSNLSDAPVKVGKTPFKDDFDSFFSRYSSLNIVTVMLVKEGYEPQEFILIAGNKSDIKISASLKISQKIATIKKHDLLMSELFRIQKLIRTQNFSEAITKLNTLSKDHPHFSIIPEMLGIAYYLSKDMEKSLSSYRQAFAINPDAQDAYTMKVYLEKKMGVDAEAGNK